ncbi:MAG: hypothetical protein NVS4B9_09360 [Ktedonobacteraceae bacterium]
MCKEATLLPTSEQTNNEHTSPYRYEVAESMQEIAATLLAVSKNHTTPVALVTIMLQFDSQGRASTSWSERVDQSIRYYLDNVRQLVRRTDRVFLYGFGFYFLLPGANAQGANIVQERLWDALLWRVHNAGEGDIMRPCRMTIGHGAYPDPHEDVHSCIAAARVVRHGFDVLPEKAARQLAAQTTREADLPILARKLGVPYLSLLPRNLPPGIKKLVSIQLALELHCYPLGRERNTPTVAMSNPQDNQALARLQQETGLSIFPVLTNPGELQMALEQLI